MFTSRSESSRKFALASFFEVSKQTPNECVRMSVVFCHTVLFFAFTLSIWGPLVTLQFMVQCNLWLNLSIFVLHQLDTPSRFSNTFPWQCVIVHTRWWNGKILNMCYLRWVYNQWPPDLLWAANRWTVLQWPHTYCRPHHTHGICPLWHPSPGCYHSQHAGKTQRQSVSVQGNTV